MTKATVNRHVLVALLALIFLSPAINGCIWPGSSPKTDPVSPPRPDGACTLTLLVHRRPVSDSASETNPAYDFWESATDCYTKLAESCEPGIPKASAPTWPTDDKATQFEHNFNIVPAQIQETAWAFLSRLSNLEPGLLPDNGNWSVIWWDADTTERILNAIQDNLEALASDPNIMCPESYSDVAQTQKQRAIYIIYGHGPSGPTRNYGYTLAQARTSVIVSTQLNAAIQSGYLLSNPQDPTSYPGYIGGCSPNNQCDSYAYWLKRHVLNHEIFHHLTSYDNVWHHPWSAQPLHPCVGASIPELSSSNSPGAFYGCSECWTKASQTFRWIL